MADLARTTFLDYETALIGPGLMLPPPAIATTYHPADGARLWLTADLPRMWDALLDDTERGGYIGGHDIARFDLPVTCQHMPWLRPRIWDLLERGRAYDTLTAERIIEINRGQRGGLALDVVALKHGVPMKSKAESQDIRLSFGQFIGAATVAPAHAEYALNDAVVPHSIADRQLRTGLVHQDDVAELMRQTFWLSHVSARGFRTDPDHVRILDALVNDRIRDLEDIAREYGFLRTDARGEVSKNMTAIKYAIACDYLGLDFAQATDEQAAALSKSGRPTKAGLDRAWKALLAKVEADPRVPHTDPSDSHPNGQVKTDRLTLEDATDPSLQALAEWDQLRYIRNKDLKIFYEGTDRPVHTRFGITDTTRPISSDPQVANFGKRQGVRECIRARQGFGIATSDFKMVELVTLAQLISERLGLTTMAGKLSEGIDMHAEIGADVLGITYEEIQARRAAGDKEADEARDSGKPAGFGMNGGMSDPRTYALYARKSYGQLLVEREPGESVQSWNTRRIARAGQIMNAWRGRAVDQQAWIRHIKAMRNALGLYDMKHPGFTNLWRHGLRATEACNNPFQIYAARVGSRAGWRIAKAQYCTGEMAGSHIIMYTYDDITSEIPLDRIAEHVDIQERIMCETEAEMCPAVFDSRTPRKRMVDTRVLSHLSKGAKASRDSGGNMKVTQVSMPEAL